jgi:uncharacterized membrane protein
MRKLIYQLHRFLTEHSFYALVLASALACGILAVRVLHLHRLSFVFLVWNLILAWVPYWLSLWASASQRRWPRDWWRLLAPGALWLLFFPNAPYIVTDLVHLYERPPVPLWFDIGLLAAFMLSGCFLAVVSLHIMQGLVRRLAGALASWLFVGAAVLLSGLGVYLGRVQRWNSWDLLIYPRDVLADAIRPLIYPASHLHPLGLSVMFAAVLFICYVMYLAAYAGGRAGALAREGERG